MGVLGDMFTLVCSVLLFLNSVESKPGNVLKDPDSRLPCPCGQNTRSRQARVVGGHDAGLGHYPYASCLIDKRYFAEGRKRKYTVPFCGATLVSDSHVVTAAHCLKNRRLENILVDIGEYDILSERLRLRPAKSVVRYPEYIPESFHTDIALIEFERPVKWKHGGLQVAQLPPKHLPLPSGSPVSVYGWGRLDYDGGHPKILQSVELPIVENRVCQKKFRSKIEKTMLCAGGEKGHDACIGDSGSGLVVRLGNDDVLCGIVSFGRKCALPHIAGVYTRVSSFTDWILENTKSSQCRPCIHVDDVPLDVYQNTSGETHGPSLLDGSTGSVSSEVVPENTDLFQGNIYGSGTKLDDVLMELKKIHNDLSGMMSQWGLLTENTQGFFP